MVVKESVASGVYPHRARFLVHAAADTVRAQLPAAAAVVLPHTDGRCEVRSGASNLDIVLMYVVLLGTNSRYWTHPNWPRAHTRWPSACSRRADRALRLPREGVVLRWR